MNDFHITMTVEGEYTVNFLVGNKVVSIVCLGNDAAQALAESLRANAARDDFSIRATVDDVNL
jgi:hypothetical protein